MSNRLLEERIKILEQEIAGLKALLAPENGSRGRKPAYSLSAAAQERREANRNLRESERDFC